MKWLQPLGTGQAQLLTVGHDIPTEPLARLLDQVARALHSLGHSEGLFPAQWAALRYIKRSAPNHCTAMQLARYQGLAFGPVSRSVRTLIEKGYLRKAGSAGRGRAELLELTEEGQALIARDPLQAVSAALANVAPQDRKTLANALASVLAGLQGGDGPPFPAV